MYEVPKAQPEENLLRSAIRDLLIISAVGAVVFKFGIDSGLLDWLIGDNLREAFEIPAPVNPIMKSIASDLGSI